MRSDEERFFVFEDRLVKPSLNLEGDAEIAMRLDIIGGYFDGLFVVNNGFVDLLVAKKSVAQIVMNLGVLSIGLIGA